MTKYWKLTAGRLVADWEERGHSSEKSDKHWKWENTFEAGLQSTGISWRVGWWLELVGPPAPPRHLPSLGAASNLEKAASTATYPKHPLQSSQNRGAFKVFLNSEENCGLQIWEWCSKNICKGGWGWLYNGIKRFAAIMITQSPCWRESPNWNDTDAHTALLHNWSKCAKICSSC